MEPLSLFKLLFTSSLLSALVAGVIVAMLNNRHARSRQLFDARIICYSKLLAKMAPMANRWLTASEIQLIFPLLEEALILSGKQLYQELNSLFIILTIEQIEREKGLTTPPDEFELKNIVHDRMRILMKHELGIKSTWRKYLKITDKDLKKLNINDLDSGKQESRTGS